MTRLCYAAAGAAPTAMHECAHHIAKKTKLTAS